MDFHLRPRRGVACLWLLPWLVACGDASSTGATAAPRFAPDGGAAPADEPQAGLEANVHVRFQLSPVDASARGFGRLPFPDNLYIDAEGAPAIAELPVSGDAGEYGSGIEAGLTVLDGFGLMGPVYFFLDGSIDPESLPTSADATLESSAAIFVVDVDTNSPEPLTRVPVEVYYDRDEGRLSLVPAPGRMFAPGRRYAAVVTADVLDQDGLPVGPDADFLALQDSQSSLEGIDLGRAKDQVRGVLGTLEELGVPAGRVAGLAVFRTQTVITSLAEAHSVVAKDGVPELLLRAWTDETALDGVLGEPTVKLGLGQSEGVAHANLGAMVQAAAPVGNFLSSAPSTPGTFERDINGTWLIKRTENVPFTLFLPRAPRDIAHVPLVVFIHGWGRERSDALAIADRFAASGMAVLSIDAPLHGSRLAESDTSHRFVDIEAPDGFGDSDVAGDPLGARAQDTAFPAYHPTMHRDLLRQWAIDHLEVLRVLRDGDLQALRDLKEQYDGLAFDTDKVAVVAMDMGATVGMMVATLSERVGVVAPLFAGGHLIRDWLVSPGRRAEADAILGALGVSDIPVELAARDQLAREYGPALYQTLLDGAEPLAWAAALRRLPVNVLVTLAEGDQLVSNRSTVALARILGASFEAREGIEPSPVNNDQMTRRLIVLPDATHEALLFQRGERAYVLEDGAYQELDEAIAFENPVEDLVSKLVLFVESWRACLREAVLASCAAQIDE